MSALRSQGRPRRGLGEVGRDRIVAKLQSVFRTGGDIDLSRKTLANLAGVTPALISYYFPKKEILLEEISRPIIQGYRREMEKIVFNSSQNDHKLRELIALLLRLYTEDEFILEIYTNVTRKTRHSGDVKPCELSQMTALFANFLSFWHGPSVVESFDAAVLQGAVWGMCRFAARIEAEQTSFDCDISPLVARVVKILAVNEIPISVHA